MKNLLRQIAMLVPGLAAILILWWLATYSLHGMMSAFSPGKTAIALVSRLSDGSLFHDTLISLQRVCIGLFFAIVIGLPAGILMGYFRTLEQLSMPVLQLLRMISPLSWMPIAVMVLGVGDHPVWFLLSFAAVWPVMFSTASGVRQLSPQWLLQARAASATAWETLCYVVIPGILGHIFTGIRLAIGILWIVLVPCEMLGVSSGLGYAILDARDSMDYSGLMAVILTIGVTGFLMDCLIRVLLRPFRAVS